MTHRTIVCHRGPKNGLDVRMDGARKMPRFEARKPPYRLPAAEFKRDGDPVQQLLHLRCLTCGSDVVVIAQTTSSDASIDLLHLRGLICDVEVRRQHPNFHRHHRAVLELDHTVNASQTALAVPRRSPKSGKVYRKGPNECFTVLSDDLPTQSQLFAAFFTTP